MITTLWKTNTFKSKILNRTFTIILNTLLIFVFVGCQKKTTEPTKEEQPQQATSKVWCFYQTNFGGHAFLYCAKTEQDYKDKQAQYSGLQIVVEIKNDCNECQ